MPALDKALKKAILALPSARKDKLLLQLLVPNQVLQDQLAFALLEGEEGLHYRRANLQGEVQSSIQGFYYNAQDLLAALRALCTALSYHSKITGDVYGEISLLLLLLKEVFTHQGHFLQTLSGNTEALGLFLAKRAEEVIQKLKKLHEDQHVEFSDEVNTLLPRMHASAAGYFARKLGLPLQWA